MKDDWESVPGMNHVHRPGTDRIHICLIEKIDGVLHAALLFTESKKVKRSSN